MKYFDIIYIWRPDQAQAVIDKQFEAYFCRRAEASPQAEQPSTANTQDDGKPSTFSLEDLVVVANISGCLNEGLTLKVYTNTYRKIVLTPNRF